MPVEWRPSAQLGMSFIEFSVALFLSALLLLTLGSVYLSVIRLSHRQQALEAVQENGRFLTQYFHLKYTASHQVTVIKKGHLPAQLNNVKAKSDLLMLTLPSREQLIFYLAASPEKTQPGNLTLYEKSIPGQRQPLVTGLRHMTVQQIGNHVQIRMQFVNAKPAEQWEILL